MLAQLRGYEAFISPQDKPPLQLSLQKKLSPCFSRSYFFGLGFPVFALEFQNQLVGLSGTLSLDGTIQGSVVIPIPANLKLLYRATATCAAATDSLQVHHTITYQEGTFALSCSSDLHSAVSAEACHRFTMGQTLHTFWGSLNFHKPTMRKELSNTDADPKLVDWEIGHFWGWEDCMGTTTYNTQENAITTNVIGLLPGMRMAGVTGKYYLESKEAVINLATRFQIKDNNLHLSLSSDWKGHFSLARGITIFQKKGNLEFGLGYSPFDFFPSFHLHVEMNT